MVDIVGDPRRFDQAWAKLQRRVSGFNIPITFDGNVAGLISRVTSAVNAIPPIELAASVDTSHIVPEVLAAEAEIPDPEITPEVNTTRMRTELAAAGARAGSDSGRAFTATFGAALIGIGTALAAGLGALTVFGLKSAATLEQTRVAFDSLAGSAESGAKIFKDLQAFAASTPFEFPEITTSARRLLAMGDAAGIAKSELTDVLTVIGNVASVTGAGAQGLDRVTLALGQIASRGKVSLEEVNQISEALPGFSGVAAIAAARGTSTGQALDDISAGAIDAQSGIDALLAGMAKFPGAAGAMEKQSQTLLGVFSTFKDVVGQTLANAFSPVIPAVKASLTELTPVLGQALSQLGPALGQGLATVLPVIGQLITALTPVLGPIVKGLADGLAAIGPALAPIGQTLGGFATALQPVLALVGGLVAAIGTALTPVLDALLPVFEQLVNVAFSVFEPLKPLIIQIGQAAAQFLIPIATLLADLFQQLSPIIQDLVTQLTSAFFPILQALGPVAVQLVSALLPLLPAIIALLPPLLQIVVALTPLIVLLAELLKLAAAIISPIILLAAELIKLLTVKAIAPVIQLLADALTQILGPLTQFFQKISVVTNFIQNINWASVGKSIQNGLVNAFKAVIDFFSKLPGRIGGFLASLPGLLVKAVNAAFDAMLESIGIGIGLILAAIIKLPPLIISGLAALPGLVADLFTFLWQRGTEITNAAISNIIAFVTSLPARIAAGLAALPGILADAFNAAFNRARDIATSTLNFIVDTVRGIPGRVAAFAGQLFDAGRALIDGFARGIRNVGNFIGDVAGDITNAIKGFLNRVIGKINDGIARVDQVIPGDLPRIPLLAKGGLALGPSIIGEKRDELAVPLNDPRAQEAIRQALGGVAGGGPNITFGPGAIVVNPAPGMTSAQAREIGDGIGAGIAGTLARRDIRTAVRMI